MEENVYSFEDYKNDVKRKERIDYIKSLPSKGVEWAKEHYVGLTIGLPIVVNGVCKLVRVVNNVHDKSEDDRHRDKMYYDPSAHVWYELRRKLTNSEKIEIAQRIKDGEKRVDILSDMNVIK